MGGDEFRWSIRCCHLCGLPFIASFHSQVLSNSAILHRQCAPLLADLEAFLDSLSRCGGVSLVGSGLLKLGLALSCSSLSFSGIPSHSWRFANHILMFVANAIRESPVSIIIHVCIFIFIISIGVSY